MAVLITDEIPGMTEEQYHGLHAALVEQYLVPLLPDGAPRPNTVVREIVSFTPR